MPYAPIDDRFDEHPKYGAFTAAQMGVIACAITFANRNLTDGVIPSWWPRRRFGDEGETIARWLCGDLELAGVRLTGSQRVWKKRKDGDFEIIGFLDHNTSKADIMAKREAVKKRVKDWRDKKNKSASNGDGNAGGNAVTNTVGNAPSLHLHVTATDTATATDTSQPPTQPQPASSGSGGVVGSGRAGRTSRARRGERANGAGQDGARLEPAWHPSPETVSKYAADGIDVRPIADRFRRHYLQAVGDKGVSADWDLKFETWVEQDVEEGTAPKLRVVNGGGGGGAPEMREVHVAAERARAEAESGTHRKSDPPEGAAAPPPPGEAASG